MIRAGFIRGDVDILVELDAPPFDHFINLECHLEERLGGRVDLAMKESLKPAVRERTFR